MENQEDNSKKGKIKFEDKEYSLDSLPKEGKDLIGGLKAAEAQLRMHEDTIKILALGRQAMARQLKEALKSVSPSE